ncbi:MAG: hypothetical protein KBF45_05825 [Cyclobacteriaceae bacterium]|jgi:hypothetical protein|nr:hypothetical protein [Cyclobacteriaceae bacterium]
MKTLFTVVLLFISLLLPAQKLIVEQRTVKNEEGNDQNSWTARLDEDMSTCMGSYENFMKEKFSAKVEKRGKNMLVAEKIQLPELTNLRMDQRTLFTTEASGTAVSFMFSLGYDVHFGLDSYPDKFEKAQDFVKSFVRYHYESSYAKRIKEIEEKIKSKQSDIESNGKRIDRNNKSIADNNKSGSDEKSKAKNDKMSRENEVYSGDSATKRREVSDLEEELNKLNESLKKVKEFK